MHRRLLMARHDDPNLVSPLPESIHQRTPLIVGSEFEMEEFARTVMTA